MRQHLIHWYLEFAERGSGGVETGGLGTLAEHLCRLVTTNTTTPLTTLIFVFVRAAEKECHQDCASNLCTSDSQVRFGSTDESGEFALIFAFDVLESKNSSGLLVHDGTEASLALDDHIRNTHLAAESGEEHDEFDGVDIVCDDDERRLLGFGEGNTMIETMLDKERLLVFGSLLLLGGSLGDALETSLLLSLGLRAISTQSARTGRPLSGCRHTCREA